MTILNTKNEFDQRQFLNLTQILMFQLVEQLNPPEEITKNINQIVKSKLMLLYVKEICDIWNQLLNEKERKEFDKFYFETNGLGNILTKRIIQNTDLLINAGKKLEKEFAKFAKEIQQTEELEV